MNSIGITILIIGGIVAAFIFYKIFKPYFLRYDTTLLMTGGLGSGKSLTSVKTAIVLIRKQRFKIKMHNFFKVKLYNTWVQWRNKVNNRKNTKLIKKHKRAIYPIRTYRSKKKQPLLYSNIPVHFKKHIFSKKREWNVILTEKHLTLIEQIREHSVVFIDELPQFINQFNWNVDIIQKNVNEFITFFRHYIGGYFITNGQATADIVVQIRRKLNQATWCFNFKKWFFGLFYTIEMLDIMLNDDINTMTTAQIEENTHKHFGLFPARNTYDTRCYSERYNNALIKDGVHHERHRRLKTNRIIKLVNFLSPLDDNTTETEKIRQRDRVREISNQ